MLVTRSSPGSSRLGVATLALLACNSACNVSKERSERSNMADPSPRVMSIFKNTKTVCFGQFLVEVPASAIVVYGPASLDGPIEYFPGEAHRIDQRIAEQLAEVEKDRKFFAENELTQFPLFGTTSDGALPKQKLVFGSKSQVSYAIYSFIPLGEDLFIQSRDNAISKEKAVEDLNRVAVHLRSRTADEVPSEAGSCIEGGLLTSEPVFEHITVGIRLEEFADVHFSIKILKNQNYLSELEGLDARLESAAKSGEQWYSQIRYLRRGPRTIGDWKGTEALAIKPPQKGVESSHEFHFISIGATNSALQPQLDIQLDTGASDQKMGAVKPSLSDMEAVALWDRLTNSIRVRPTSSVDDRLAALAKQQLPPARRTGEKCTQTGWWVSDGRGAAQRHFTVGEELPFAIVFAQQTLWQKLTGTQPVIEESTTWRFAEASPRIQKEGADMADGFPCLDPVDRDSLLQERTANSSTQKPTS